MSERKFWWEQIPRNESLSFPKRIVVVDTETKREKDEDKTKHHLRLACAQTLHFRQGELVKADDIKTFTKAKDFWLWLESITCDKTATWVVAHNADFDFLALGGLIHLHELGWSPVFFAWDWGKWLSVFRKGEKTLRIFDSLNIFPESLQAIGKRVGLEKLPMPEEEASQGEWEEYCARDVEILSKALQYHVAYVKGNDLGSLRTSIPAQAFTAYRHRFLTEPIYVHHITRYQELERFGYYGGRCEAYFLGRVPVSHVYYLDVQSMYGDIMARETFPVRLLSELQNPSIKELAKLLPKFEIMAKVELDTKEPAFPFRDDLLLFPVGRFSTVLPSPELNYALEKGYVKKVHWALVYARGRPFREYAEFFFHERKKARESGDALGEYIAKLFLNSLYGKFAQRVPKYATFQNRLREPPGLEIMYDVKTERFSVRITVGDKVFVSTGERSSRYTFFPIAAWVTSYGRIRLWELLKRVWDGHVFYCDTDGLIVDDEGLSRLSDEISPGIPGKLRVKKEGNKLVIYGAKDYELDGERYLKGVPREAVEVAQGVWRYNTFIRTKTALRKGLILDVVEEERTRRRSSPYRKGKVQPTGWVEPIRVQP